MKEIPLTQGKFVLVDDEDYDRFHQDKWKLTHNKRDKTFYASKDVYINGNKTTRKMHRIILGIEDSKIFVDHIDGNGLNNCKENLRIATNQQNQQNRGKPSNNKTGYKGVSFFKSRNKFKASIKHGHRDLFLGYFSTAEDASKEYEAKAKELFGIFYKKD